MRRLLIVTTTIVSLISCVAFAEDQHSLGLEASQIDLDQDLANTAYLGSDDEILPTVRYGYELQLSEFFIRPSASYTIGDLEVKNVDGSNDKTTVSQLFTIEGDLGYDVTKKLSVFGTCGLAKANLERNTSGTQDDSSETGLLFGFGAQYDISSSLSVNARYQNIAIDYPSANTSYELEAEMNIVKVGISYNFQI